MTIGGSDPIPSGYFHSGANLVTDGPDGLRQLLNRMKTAAASLGYAYMGLGATSQDTPGIGEHVEWSASSISGDLITLSTGAGQQNGIVTLAASHTYRVTFGVDLEVDAGEEAILQVYDRIQSATLVPDGSAALPKVRCRAVGATGGRCGLVVCSFLFTPSVNTAFDIRIESVSGGAAVDVIYNYSWMTIDVLG